MAKYMKITPPLKKVPLALRKVGQAAIGMVANLIALEKIMLKIPSLGLFAEIAIKTITKCLPIICTQMQARTGQECTWERQAVAMHTICLIGKEAQLTRIG
jgi:hypothetical protein